jgi:hypothetical protein
MNERIRELADQILPNEKEFHQGDPKDWGYFFTGEELGKFTELLVTAVMAAVRDEIQYEYDWTLADIVTERVKKEFGVQ